MTGRRAAWLALLALLAVSFAWHIVLLALPPGPYRNAPDSWSGRDAGTRALLELLARFDVPTRRSLDVPPRLFQGPRRILLLQPDLRALELEHAYLGRIAAWVGEGGQLLVAATSFSREDESTDWLGGFPPPGSRGDARRDLFESLLGDAPFLSALDLAQVRTEWSTPAAPDVPMVSFSRRRQRQPDLDYAVRGEGLLAEVADGIATVRLPATRLRLFADAAGYAADGVLRVRDTRAAADAPWLPIACAYRRGAGTVTLVSEPLFLTNLGLGEADNAAIAFRLAAGDGRTEVVFDEYYHGLLPTGKPSSLLLRSPYRLIALSLVAATALWAWAGAVRFGPPLAPRPAPRRTIVEYIDAMAHLFRRAGKRSFVLAGCRAGLLDALRAEFALAAGASREVILARLQRTDPARARRVTDALAACDAALAARRSLSTARLTELHERLAACRNPSPPPQEPPPTSPRSTSRPSPRSRRSSSASATP